MRNPLEQRCAQLERSMRTLHDECDRLMRENELLRERMQRYGSGRTEIRQVEYQLAGYGQSSDQELYAY